MPGARMSRFQEVYEGLAERCREDPDCRESGKLEAMELAMDWGLREDLGVMLDEMLEEGE